jgi:hypothetical protein
MTLAMTVSVTIVCHEDYHHKLSQDMCTSFVLAAGVSARVLRWHHTMCTVCNAMHNTAEPMHNQCMSVHPTSCLNPSTLYMPHAMLLLLLLLPLLRLVFKWPAAHHAGLVALVYSTYSAHPPPAPGCAQAGRQSTGLGRPPCMLRRCLAALAAWLQLPSPGLSTCWRVLLIQSHTLQRSHMPQAANTVSTPDSASCKHRKP